MPYIEYKDALELWTQLPKEMVTDILGAVRNRTSDPSCPTYNGVYNQWKCMAIQFVRIKLTAQMFNPETFSSWYVGQV